MPSPIDCRLGSRESLRDPILARDVSSPYVRQFQLSGHTGLLRQNASSLNVVFVTIQKGLRFPPLRVLLQVMGCLAQSVSVYTFTDCGIVMIFDQPLCTGDTFQASCDALHVHLVAHWDKGSFVLFPSRITCLCAPYTWSRHRSRVLQTKHGNHVSAVLRVCFNRVSGWEIVWSMSKERRIEIPDPSQS